MVGLDPAGEKNASQVLGSAVALVESSLANAVPLGTTAIAAAVVSVLGVVLMWRLKRIGFWIYVVAALVSVVVPMVLLGGGVLAMFSVGVSGLIAIAFIVLYATHRKYMR